MTFPGWRWIWGVGGLAALFGCARPDSKVSQAVEWRIRLDRHACGADVASRLARWGVDGGASAERPGQLARGIASPPLPGGATEYRFPTGVIGHWVILTLPTSGSPGLTRIAPEGARLYAWGRECRVEETEVSSLVLPGAYPPSSGDRSGTPERSDPESGRTAQFTDADLAASAPKGCSGVIPLVVYVWSPHMPLSVDGYREIHSAAQQLGLGVAPVLFAGSDPNFARDEAIRGAIPEEGLRQVASIELVLRDAQIHAPTIIVFGGDRISAPLPGYRNRAGYVDYLTDFLSGSCEA